MRYMMNDQELNAQDIMNMATGFWVSKTLFSGFELGVFESLSNESAKADELAGRLGLPTNSLERLLIALTSLGLLVKNGDQFTNSKVTKSFLLKSSPTFIGGYFAHFSHHLYPLWNYLENAIGENSSRWP